MSNESGIKAGAAPAEDAGKNGRDAGALDSFKGASGTVASGARGISSTGKKNVGRPRKDGLAQGSGPAPKSAPMPARDPMAEAAARGELEEGLVDLLVLTTEEMADSRFEILKAKYPEAVARSMADKALLTDREKKAVRPMIMRIWNKYVGEETGVTDEILAAVLTFRYLLRNWEPMRMVKQTKAIINGKTNPQQPGLQSQQLSNPRSEANGQIDSGLPARPSPPGSFGSDL